MDTSRDVAMIEDDDRWPLGSILPVKRFDFRKKKYDDFGVIVFHQKNKVRLTNVMEAKDMSVTQIEQVPCMEYESVEALVADGWLVD